MGTPSGHVDVPPQAPAEMFTIWKKQSTQRFTTGILTQQDIERRRCKKDRKKGLRRWRGCGKHGSPDDGGKRKSDERPEAGKAVNMQTDSCGGCVCQNPRGWERRSTSA